jgi:hypothetical protein
MKHLFLTSTVEQAGVVSHIRSKLDVDQRLKTAVITTQPNHLMKRPIYRG